MNPLRQINGVWHYGCYEVILSEVAADFKYIQKRKHKKRRINKKWLKRYGYLKVLKEYKSFVFENKMIMHPILFEKMKKYLEAHT